LAQQLDPLSMPINYNKIMSLLINDKIDEAQEHYNKISYMFSSHDQCSLGGYIKSLKNNDLTEMVEAFKTGLEKEPNNSGLHSDLSYYYRGVWNDYNNALKHAKRAFELNSTSGNLAEKLLYELFWDQQFKEAQALLNDPKVFDLFDDVTKAVLNQDYYAFQGDFKKAIPYNDQLKALDLKRYYVEKTLLYSRMGDKITVNEMMNIANNEISDDKKAQIFANIKLNDSMYYYLHRFTKIESNTGKIHNSIEINGRIEFDPYRMEPRYIAFLKDNYFPVSKE
jgi:tetratricopeptide (TPR) repeat protein